MISQVHITDERLTKLRELLEQAENIRGELEKLNNKFSIRRKLQLSVGGKDFLLIPANEITLPETLAIRSKYRKDVPNLMDEISSQISANAKLIEDLNAYRSAAITSVPTPPKGFFKWLTWSQPTTWPELESYRKAIRSVFEHPTRSELGSFVKGWDPNIEVELKEAFTLGKGGYQLKPEYEASLKRAAHCSPNASVTLIAGDHLGRALKACEDFTSQSKPSQDSGENATVRDIRQLLESLRHDRAVSIIDRLGTEKLREATTEKLRLPSGLSERGIRSVGDVYRAKLHRLQSIPGIGEQTASRMKAAAQSLYNEEHNSNNYRIGSSGAPAEREIVALLREYQTKLESTDRIRPLFDAYARPLRRLAINVDSRSKDFILVAPTKADQNELLTSLTKLGACNLRTQRASWSPSELSLAWKDYLSRPAEFQALLAKLLGVDSTDAGLEYLDKDTIEAIRRLNLDTSLMRDSYLRGYQLFAAKFLVVQRKMLLGDEMGLGKTLQAISAAAHVCAKNKMRKGTARVLIVAPASLLINWEREIQKFSLLRAFVAHGQQRASASKEWNTRGGMLITTYETLRTLDLREPTMVIVDEAHMIKNPEAQRTKAVVEQLEVAEYAMLMTGTPIENKLDEFSTLLTFLDPEMGQESSKVTSPREFKRIIAPLYLRRNQSDVLDELPEKVEATDWVELTQRDQEIYREAIADGAWMAARRAAMVSGPNSAKMTRIRELVEEAREEGRNVLIFSYFRDVLDLLQREFHQCSIGIIDGSVSAGRRQKLVDALGNSGHLLLAQITAGGVGLNIQHSSVVIFTEVQVKPSLEDQAIARSHRMGQINVVNVHRIAGRNTIDERLLEIVANKREVFNKFAREAESARIYDAKDITEIKIAQSIIESERIRLGIRSTTPVTIGNPTDSGQNASPSAKSPSRSAQSKRNDR